MKQQIKTIKQLVILLAILLVCLLAPSASLATFSMSNDNHTDTDDYCLRAFDVTIGLSDFADKTRAELESAIISASSFAFLIRNTVSESGSFEPVISGYSVDFSNLTEAASSSGYVITVTLPAITMPQSSQIQFRVFVEDDLPHPCTVHYEFVSDPSGQPLPAGVTAQLPADESILSGTTVTPSAALAPVRSGAGEWTFSGWSPASIALTGADVTFTGSWVWTALPVYTVSFEFVSGTGGRALPDGVLVKLPVPTTGMDTDTITPPATFRAVHMVEGAWRFHGWDSSSRTISGGDITFTGVWRWHWSNPVVTQSPASTPALGDNTQYAAMAPPENTPAVSPNHLPELPPIQVLEQAPNDPQPPMENDRRGGMAQMVIATVLTALVAVQAFAVASDLKVLKWYNAKKAARRAGI